MEVTRAFDIRSAGGDRVLWFRFDNVGTIACTVTLQLAKKSTSTAIPTGTLAVGQSKALSWNKANPLTVAHLPGVYPSNVNGNACDIEVTRQYYRQRLNDGVPEREFVYTVKNVGTSPCSGTIRLATIAA